MIATESESEKLVAGRLRLPKNQTRWFLHTDLLTAQMHFSKPSQSHPDRIRVGFVTVQYDP